MDDWDFDDDFMLRRLDYVTDVLGGVAAHYCYDHVTIDGLILPTLRRVVRRTPEDSLLSGRTSSFSTTPTWSDVLQQVRDALDRVADGWFGAERGDVPVAVEN